MKATGDIIGGTYRLQYPLGEGGMGAVWCAEHVHLRSTVAVKLLNVNLSGAAGRRAVGRFLREGQVAASVRHPNVVNIHDLGEDDGTPYLVMELLQGVPLAERMQLGAPMTVSAFLDIIRGTVDGLRAVHAAGIVHRDLKPENIFLVQTSTGDHPKLLDFGVSRATERDRGHTITAEGIVPGTPEYVAPERARSSHEFDPRSDLYSLGVVMYEGFAGRLPFEADNVADLIAALLASAPPPLQGLRPDLPRSLTDFVMKAMAHRPERRFDDAAQMRAALDAVIESVGDAGNLQLRKPAPGARGTTVPTGLPLPPHTTTVAGTPAEARTLVRSLPPGLQHRRWLGLAAAVTVSVVGALAWFAIGRSNSDAATAGVDHARTAARTGPGQRNPTKATGSDLRAPAPGPSDPLSPAPQAKPGSPQAQTRKVYVDLKGVPANATVTVDGVTAQGPRLEFTRGSARHTIEVRAPRRKPWRVSHQASADGSYRVSLQRRRSTPGSAADRRRQGKGDKDLVRELDF